MKPLSFQVLTISTVLLVHECSTAAERITSTNEPRSIVDASLSSQFGESALLDKETGQVYWNSGPIKALPSFFSEWKHAKATVLSVFVLTGIASLITNRIKFVAVDSDNYFGVAMHLVADVLNWIVPSFMTSPNFVVLVVLLYFLEAYTSSTRRYLDNMSTPQEVQDLLERLRSNPPTVKWTVRCYHYENRLLGARSDLKSIESSTSSKKVITHTATSEFNFGSWKDNTVTSVFARSQSFHDGKSMAPFTKLSLSKILVLSDIKAREDYFSQQANFVSLEGRRDDHAEFSTSINVPDFKPKILAVKTILGAPGTGMARSCWFWFFTFLGLTVPFRRWFSKYCDELCVTIVKEVTASDVYPRKSLLPKLWSNKNNDSLDEDNFVKNMKELSIYSNNNPDHEYEQSGEEEIEDGANNVVVSKAETSVVDSEIAVNDTSVIDDDEKEFNETSSSLR